MQDSTVIGSEHGYLHVRVRLFKQVQQQLMLCLMMKENQISFHTMIYQRQFLSQGLSSPPLVTAQKHHISLPSQGRHNQNHRIFFGKRRLVNVESFPAICSQCGMLVLGLILSRSKISIKKKPFFQSFYNYVCVIALPEGQETHRKMSIICMEASG